jgi:two-component system nitrogen regulation response regulator GlnG
MSESLAAADLFGTVKGAYTGAQAARRGLWAEAHEGTLFLDEIGDTPAAVQPMLLRAIETGEFRPLGSNDMQCANVRVIAATDRALEGSSFNQPLLRRLEGFVIRTPALRTRREDIGVLVQRMLYDLRVSPDWPAKVPAPLLRALCLHAWPGNVRQLMNVVRHLVVSARAGEWPTVPELFGSVPVESAISAQITASTVPVVVPGVSNTDAAVPHAYVSPASIAPDALLAALDRAGWCLRAAAIDLGISRPSLYNLIDRHPDIRRAQMIPQAEIEAAMDQGASSIEVLAIRLRTPRDAQRRRLHGLGVGLPAMDPTHPH